MKRLALLLAMLFCLPSLASCRQVRTYSESFYLMDTLVGVTLYTDDPALAEQIFDECECLLRELDGLWSRHRSSSEISRFNAAQNGLDGLDGRTLALFRTALDVSARTNGAFDVTVTPLIALWERCGEEDRLPTEAELATAKSAVGYGYLTLTDTGVVKQSDAVAVDLGGIGKGAAISRLIEYLSTTGVSGGLVSFGSNVAVFGEKPDGEPFRVAIKHPRTENAVIGKLTLGAGEVLSVSGDYERYVTIGGNRYHHILDPKTGYPADTGLASVAVISTDGAEADALSTALFVMELEDAMAFYASGAMRFEAIFVDTAGQVTVTNGLADRFEKEGT